MRTEVSIEAPCKINLHLRIRGRRSDGFHELESIFLALAFGDTLHFKLKDAGADDEFLMDDKRPAFTEGLRTAPREELPQGNNIVLRALHLFRAKTGFARPLRVRLEKRIPLGAGLGGGSSDGASTLLALNELAGAPLSGDQLRGLGAELGSDVPFFLGGSSGTRPGAAFVTGRGEHIRPIEGPPELPVLLVNPGFPSNTGEAFRLLDAQEDALGLEPAPSVSGLSPEALIGALKAPPSRWPYRNDFLPVFLARGKAEVRDAYTDILDSLKAQGADFCGLTGSGSTCFGIFTNGGTAEQAAKSLARPGYSTFLSFPLRV